jgi:hypothetical protein
MVSDTSVMTLDTSSTNASSGSCISCQQEIQLPLGDVSCVQVFSAPSSLSQMLQVIAQYFLEICINVGIGTMIWMAFFRQCLCHFLPLKVASKTRTFQLCFCSHENFFHNCTLKSSLDLHSVSASRPSVNTASVWHVIQYTDRQA